MTNPFRKIQGSVAVLCFVAGSAGCKHTIAVEPIEVKPIHMTLDINLKVDRELEEFFDETEGSATTAPATADGVTEQPAASPDASGTPGGQS